MFRNDLEPRSSPKYMCAKCDYGTCKHSNYMKHLSTRKHIAETARKSEEIARKSDESEEIDMFPYKCVNCIKQYKNRDGLWKHNKKCSKLVNQSGDISNIDTMKRVLEILNDIKDSNTAIHNTFLELQSKNCNSSGKL